MKILLLFTLLIFSMSPAFASAEKIALIIGNSKYQNLGSLNNTTNDAKLIEKNLKEIGFKTQIILDANEQQTRKVIRSFAIESENTNIALIFYAGHGAQVFSQNYLLPTDIDIPKRESDIQLSGIKVDDIINSIHSKVKVVILDACRDNPALIKSLSKGRGSYHSGLAPAKNSSLTDTSSGIFVAYATDSGNVALDGNEKNSPFTFALAKYIKEPISIDDMFSKVTKEVRQKTNNAQKPYKYASLDGIVCLTSNCSGISTNKSSSLGIADESSKQIFSNSNSEIQRLAMVANFYSHNKDTKNTKEIDFSSHQLPNEWLIFNYDNTDHVWSINPSTFKKTKKIVTGDVRSSPLKSSEITATYSYAINCETFKAGMYMLKESDSSGKITKDIKYGEPEHVELDADYSIKETIGYTGAMLACNPEFMVPLIPASTGLNSEEWHRTYTSENEKTQNYYLPSSINVNENKIYVLIKEKWNKPQKLSENSMFALLKDKDSSLFKWEQRVNLVVTECNIDKYQLLGENLYDEKGRLFANYGHLESTRKLSILNVLKGTTMDTLRKEYCK
ncbi:caspase family protein [Candidatus Methylopumilus planktonicus]|uniref:caspase family protein n=1 Tax=Candidatus Methylopumilus planktonicus TaxID=1581557 RepID=UPI0011234246|nr:caspase family protein [Candidatus Methylopumilus planktonicus]QDD00529.1 caspase family protein [Candidatus Methylopumilus planktonicus]